MTDREKRAIEKLHHPLFNASIWSWTTGELGDTARAEIAQYDPKDVPDYLHINWDGVRELQEQTAAV